MSKIFKSILVLVLIASVVFNNFDINHIYAKTIEEKEYAVTEDAFIRSDRASNSYNYESITKAHGEQYVDKNYKVLNTKHYSDGRQIMSVMKLKLPTKEEALSNGFDTYKFEFNIFKNPDFNNGTQMYQFYYATETNWNETALTWSNKPSCITKEEADLLFEFSIEKGIEYENKIQDEKCIRVDVSNKIAELIEQGVSEITVFSMGSQRLETSLMIHSRESGDGTLSPKLIAINNDASLTKLSELLNECKNIQNENYSKESLDNLNVYILEAEEALNNKDTAKINNAYNNLVKAKKALVIEYDVLDDAFVRSDRATNTYDNESITKAHGEQYIEKNYKVINGKRYVNGNEIIGVLKFDLPTAEDIVDKELDTFKLEFNMFKNANPNIGDQTYRFFYTTDTEWDEGTISWKNKPNSIKHDGENLLCEFEIKQGVEYEVKTDVEKHISLDISDKIKDLTDANIKQITVFVSAEKGMDTSIMFHSKESADGTLGAKITGAYIDYKEDLSQLIEECRELEAERYTEESYSKLKKALEDVESIESLSPLEIHILYNQLLEAKNSLVSIVDPDDLDNVAFQKPTRSNLSKQITSNVTDGDIKTTWSGLFYPSYVDIDLMDTYAIEKLKVYIPEGKLAYYTVYGSNDGSNFDRLYTKHNDVISTNEGDEIIFENAQSYRILRLYMEYTKGEDKAYLSEVKVYGSPTLSNVENLRDGSLEEILNVKSYDETDYSKKITNEETIENVYGIIERTIGIEYCNWFTFELLNDNSSNDWYEISYVNDKIHIKGNQGLSLTTGLNYYFKNYLNVHISEQTMQINMPETLVQLDQVIRKETPYKVRYAYNYCTLCYTFAFFGEEEWQRENDWLALNGVNVVLDLAGQEATWIKFLMNFGYSFDDAKDWLTGPAYYAWQFMDNMESFGGPVPDGYIKDRLELARSSQRWKNSLGMQTILQGYAGMVPTNFNEYQPNVKVIKQGNWNGFARPDMIATDSPIYDEYSKLFYDAQEFVYGPTSDYYAVDPFHEGGIRPQGLGDDVIASEVLESMLSYDKDAVWVVQGWQSNPTNLLLKGMGEHRKDHVLIVDLIKYPISDWTKYDRTSYGSTKLDAVEFNGTSWAWGLLANFGGNPSMHGEMEVMVNDILKAQKECSNMVGLGIISEAQFDNPIIYDLIFDLAWADDDFNLDNWVNKYIERRYGGITENVELAWEIMKDSNYDHGVRYTNELFGMKSKAPQDYGRQNIPYGANNLETALRLLLRDFDTFKDSECYLYDLSEIMRQQVSNYAVLKYNDVLDAVDTKDIDSFKIYKEEFLKAFEILNEVESTQQEQLGGEWIGKAQDLAREYDDFAMDSFTMNAKSLITSWGSSSGHRSLKDYGWRNYEGIFKDLYTNVWTDYMNRVEANLIDGAALNNISRNGYFDMYWKWNMESQEYTRDAKDSPEEVLMVLNKVIENCAISGEVDPNVGNIAMDGIATDTRSKRINANSINDGDISTYYLAKTINNKAPEVIVDLIGNFQLSNINVILNYNENIYYHYEVWVSENGIDWKKIGEKKDDSNEVEGGINFEVKEGTARYIKLIATKDSAHDESEMEIQIAEIRAYGEKGLATQEQLKQLIDFAENLKIVGNGQDEVDQFNQALSNAQNAINNNAAPDEVYTVYWNLYNSIIDLNLDNVYNLALKKNVTAHNDPSGNSNRLVDGSTSNGWDAGRLSKTGAPYEEKITPAWAYVDLEDEYQIEKIEINFGKQIWHHYAVYVSNDGESWNKIGFKDSNSLPNINEDTYNLVDITARYVKVEITDVQLESSGKRHPVSVTELVVMGREIPVDNSSLVEAIEKAEKIDVNKYTTNTADRLSKAIAEAKKVNDNVDATEKEVKDAVTLIETAISELVERADKSALADKIARAEAMDTSIYTAESVAVLTKAIEEAKEVNDNVDAVAKDVEEAMSKLDAGIAGLEIRQEVIAKEQLLENLNKIVEQVAGMNSEEYTADSWKALMEAIAKAEAVVENEEASIEDIAKAMEMLDKANASLEKVTTTEPIDPTEPEKPDTEDRDKNTSNNGTNTGDTTNTGLWITLMLGAGALLVIRKRNIKA